MNDKMEGLEILHPLGMPWIKFVLPLDEFGSLMIEMEDELFPHQVLSPMLQCPHNCIKFLVIA